MKRLPLLIIIILVLPFILSAAPPDNATLTLTSRVDKVFMHGFFSSKTEGGVNTLPQATSLTSLDVFGQFTSSGFFEDGFGYTDKIGNVDREVDSSDFQEDFDFGEAQYDLGYYLIVTNVMGNITIDFDILPFHSLTTGFTVPWTLEVSPYGGNTGYTGVNKYVSGGTLGFNAGTEVSENTIISTSNTVGHLFGALELKMLTENIHSENAFEAMIPAADDYEATVVAKITGP